MKFFILLFLFFSLTAFADLNSDAEAIATFKTEEFDNSKNYVALTSLNGTMTDEFVTSLLADERKLRYFYVCYLQHHFLKRYKVDKVFTQEIEKKYDRKPLTEEQEKSLSRSFASLVYSDKLESLKTALPDNDRESEEYFLKIMNQLEKVRLR
jgi:hypothetical protein